MENGEAGPRNEVINWIFSDVEKSIQTLLIEVAHENLHKSIKPNPPMPQNFRHLVIPEHQTKICAPN